MGKIAVKIGTLKAYTPLTTLPNPSEDTINDKLMQHFKTNYENRDLRMIDLEKLIWSLKVSWIKRIIDPRQDTLFKQIYINKLKDFFDTVYFECNFSEENI